MFQVDDDDFFEDFTQLVIFEPSAASNDVRRQCFGIFILDDDVYEGTETFEINLILDLSTSGVIIDPPVTEVTILDDDGKYSAFH